MRKQMVSKIPIAEGLPTNINWLPIATKVPGSTRSFAP